MVRNKKKELFRLIINISVIAVVVVAGIIVFRKCSSDNNSEWELEHHPLKIENIRKIAELSTVSYQDEVVIDTLEYYDGLKDQISGNIKQLASVDDWKYSVRGSYVKRRLTLIVGGEVRYGFDLKDTVFNVTSSNDTVFVTVSEPKILDVLVVPSKTIVFQEHGNWNDHARRKLQQKAINELTNRSQQLGLAEKSKKQLESLMQKLISDRVLIVTYK